MITPDFSMTTLEAAMANTTAAVKIQVDQFNQQLIGGYRTAFANWSLSVVAGRDAGPVPEVPPAYVLGYFTDETNEKARWAYPVRGTDPVMSPLTPPPAPKPYVPPVLPEPESIRNVPLGDTMPVGFVILAQDGAKWQKQSSHTPFGIAYFYAKVG